MSALRPQSFVCTRLVSSKREELGALGPAQVEEQRPGVGVRPPAVHLAQRMVEAIEQEVAHRSERRRRQVRGRRRLPEQLEHLPVARHHVGDALVDRRVAPELMLTEPAPEVREVIGGVAHLLEGNAGPGMPLPLCRPGCALAAGRRFSR